MTLEQRIAQLEAEVAALHLFIISFTASKDSAGTQKEFDSQAGALQNALQKSGMLASADRVHEAVNAVTGRNITHLVR
jgi:hypothetical protein